MQHIKGTHVERKIKSLNKQKTIENVTVKKNGKLVNKQINLQANKFNGDIVLKAMDKNATKNMFKDLRDK